MDDTTDPRLFSIFDMQGYSAAQEALRSWVNGILKAKNNIQGFGVPFAGPRGRILTIEEQARLITEEIRDAMLPIMRHATSIFLYHVPEAETEQQYDLSQVTVVLGNRHPNVGKGWSSQGGMSTTREYAQILSGMVTKEQFTTEVVRGILLETMKRELKEEVAHYIAQHDNLRVEQVVQELYPLFEIGEHINHISIDQDWSFVQERVKMLLEGRPEAFIEHKRDGVSVVGFGSGIINVTYAHQIPVSTYERMMRGAEQGVWIPLGQDPEHGVYISSVGEAQVDHQTDIRANVGQNSKEEVIGLVSISLKDLLKCGNQLRYADDYLSTLHLVQELGFDVLEELRKVNEEMPRGTAIDLAELARKLDMGLDKFASHLNLYREDIDQYQKELERQQHIYPEGITWYRVERVPGIRFPIRRGGTTPAHIDTFAQTAHAANESGLRI